MSKAILGGAVAGLIGALIWGGITYATHMEIGWIAWGIGFLVGMGVRVGTGGEESTAVGVVAALLALGSVLAGKFLAVYFIVAGVPAIDVKISPQSMMISNALDICDERAAKGKPATGWPPGMDAKKANKPEDFPRDVWKEAVKRWESLSPEQQREEIKKRQEFVRKITDDLRGDIRARGFQDSFSPFDLLWGFLAISTAYKIAAGFVSNE